MVYFIGFTDNYYTIVYNITLGNSDSQYRSHSTGATEVRSCLGGGVCVTTQSDSRMEAGDVGNWGHQMWLTVSPLLDCLDIEMTMHFLPSIQPIKILGLWNFSLPYLLTFALYTSIDCFPLTSIYLLYPLLANSIHKHTNKVGITTSASSICHTCVRKY